MRDLAGAPAILDRLGLDGWLLYDFKGQNPTARAVLGLEEAHLSRRFFAYLDRTGRLTLLLHAIEQQPFEAIPAAARHVYAGHEALHAGLRELLRGARRIAMEYCPMASIPYLSRIDAGTLELVRSLGVEVASSADLVQELLCVLTEAQRASHERASAIVNDAKDAAFARIRAMLDAGETPMEHGIQAFILERFDAAGMITDGAPIVAVDGHAGNPHYGPHESRPTPIREGQTVLIDLWGKLADPSDVFADITWVGHTGPVPSRVAELFGHVAAGRDAGLELIRDRRARKELVRGFEVDRAVRDRIAASGFGERFIHRTGHNISAHANHGDGANLDDFETHDERPLIDGTCFSIEPGIYLPDVGLRSEIDVFLDLEGIPRVYTPIQSEVVRI